MKHLILKIIFLILGGIIHLKIYIEYRLLYNQKQMYLFHVSMHIIHKTKL